MTSNSLSLQNVALLATANEQGGADPLYATWIDSVAGTGTTSRVGNLYSVNALGFGNGAIWQSLLGSDNGLGVFDFTCTIKLTAGSGTPLLIGEPVTSLPTTGWGGWWLIASDDGLGTVSVTYRDTSDNGVSLGTVGYTIGVAYPVRIRRLLGKTIMTINGTDFSVNDEQISTNLAPYRTRIVLGDSQTSFDSFSAEFDNPVANIQADNLYDNLFAPSTYGTLRTTPIVTDNDAQTNWMGQILLNTRRVVSAPNGVLTGYFLSAGSPAYPGLFAWDNYWASILLRQVGAVDFSRNLWTQLLSWRNTGDGCVPQFCTPGSAPYEPVVGQQFTHPYVAQACYLLSYDGDCSWFSYPDLQAHISYWENHKKSPRGLFTMTEGREGWDGFAAVNPLQTDPGPLNTYEWIGANSMMYREYLSIAGIASTLGHTGDAATYLASANSLKSLIQTTGWDSTHSWFNSYNINTSGFLDIKQADGAYALFAGVATTGQAQIIRDALMNSGKFWRPGGITTIETGSSYYDPSNIGLFFTNWNGPVWQPVQYLASWGLKRYGYDSDAVAVADRAFSLYAVNKNNTSSFGLPGECNAPEDGTWLSYSISPFYGWNGLAVGCPAQLRHNWNPTEINPISVVRSPSWS